MDDADNNGAQPEASNPASEPEAQEAAEQLQGQIAALRARVHDARETLKRHAQAQDDKNSRVKR